MLIMEGFSLLDSKSQRSLLSLAKSRLSGSDPWYSSLSSDYLADVYQSMAAKMLDPKAIVIKLVIIFDCRYVLI